MIYVWLPAPLYNTKIKVTLKNIELEWSTDNQNGLHLVKLEKQRQAFLKVCLKLYEGVTYHAQESSTKDGHFVNKT